MIFKRIRHWFKRLPIPTIAVRGYWHVVHRNKAGIVLEEFDCPNGVVDVGKTHMLNAEFRGGAQVTTWYCGLVNAAPTFAAADTMSSHAGWTEFTAYSESVRQTWAPDAPSGTGTVSITKSTPMVFTVNADGSVVRGVFITTNSTKSGTTGTLFSTADFGADKNADTGDTYEFTYRLDLT